MTFESGVNFNGKWFNGHWFYAFSENPMAPEFLLDDIGLANEKEEPRPGTYVRKPCKCGIKHSWTTKKDQTFVVGTLVINDVRIQCKLCPKCRETLMLQLEKTK